MKVIIAAGIYPPAVGGPAIYLKKLSKLITERGVKVKIITYARKKRPFIKTVARNYPLPVRYAVYFWKLFNMASGRDIVYAQDLFSCGLPSALAGKLRGSKLAIRLGGDFLWEKAVAQGWTKKPLSEYYQQPKNFKEKIFIFLGRWVLRRADLIIFSTEWQRGIYLKNYSLAKEKTALVKNPFPEIEVFNESSSGPKKKIIFAGRLIKLKNIALLIKAFEKVVPYDPDLRLEIIGEGPQKKELLSLAEKTGLESKISFKKGLSHSHLLTVIGRAWLVALPSLSEVSPNLALEAIKIGKPILLTKETGFYQRFKNDLIFINPLSESDLANKIITLLDGNQYNLYQKRILSIDKNFSWPEAADQHIKLFKKIL